MQNTPVRKALRYATLLALFAWAACTGPEMVGATDSATDGAGQGGSADVLFTGAAAGPPEDTSSPEPADGASDTEIGGEEISEEDGATEDVSQIEDVSELEEVAPEVSPPDFPDQDGDGVADDLDLGQIVPLGRPCAAFIL